MANGRRIQEDRPRLANLCLNRLDWQVNERCELCPGLVRYADDFVLRSRPGQGPELMGRLQRWLERNGRSARRRAAEEVIPEVSRLLKGGGGTFHYANARGRLTGSTRRRPSGGNAGGGARVDATKPGGRRTHRKFIGNATACFGCPRGRPGRRRGRRSEASERPRKAGCGKTARPV